MDTIERSVGSNGSNQPDDVRTVQTLLNGQTIPGVSEPLVVDGIAGARTIQRIELYQSRVLGFAQPDGRVDPDGQTLMHLRDGLGAGPSRATKALSLSAGGRGYLESLESLSLQPYDDQTGKAISSWVRGATIGYGHLIAKSDWTLYKDGMTREQADHLLSADLAPFEQTVNTVITAPLTQQQFDALVIFAFNIGSGAFAKSSVVKLVNDPAAKTSYRNLEAAWMAWTKSQGRQMAGLVKRRNAEWNLYAQGIYP